MSKDKEVAVSGGLWRELFQPGVYKRSQGRITRQVTFAALALVFAIAAWRTRQHFDGSTHYWTTMLPFAIVALGLWFSFRLVNLPRFADFLIGVEAEMNKVSWPSRGELIRSTIVVIFVMFSLAAILFGYDFIWSVLLKAVGVGITR